MCIIIFRFELNVNDRFLSNFKRADKISSFPAFSLSVTTLLALYTRFDCRKRQYCYTAETFPNFYVSIFIGNECVLLEEKEMN